MLDQPEVSTRSIGDLAPVNSDSLLALIELAKADPRPHKIDVGVGVYRDSAGNTPILRVIKEAERRLLENQETKAYLGGRGDVRFTASPDPATIPPTSGSRGFRHPAAAAH